MLNHQGEPAATKDRALPVGVAAAALADVPIFSNLSTKEREQLAAVAHIERYATGDMIFREGGRDARLCVVLSGQCEVMCHPAHDGAASPLRLAVLERNDSFGEMSFFDRAPHSADVRAASPVELLCIDSAEFDRLTEAGSTAACKLALASVRTLAERLRRMDHWVAQLAGAETRRVRVDEWSNFRKQLQGIWKA